MKLTQEDRINGLNLAIGCQLTSLAIWGDSKKAIKIFKYYLKSGLISKEFYGILVEISQKINNFIFEYKKDKGQIK